MSVTFNRIKHVKTHYSMQTTSSLQRIELVCYFVCLFFILINVGFTLVVLYPVITKDTYIILLQYINISIDIDKDIVIFSEPLVVHKSI